MKCWECEIETEVIHHHHVVPQSRGGTKTVPLCEPCHSKAHHKEKNMTTSKLTKEALKRKKEAGEFLGRPPKGFKREYRKFLIDKEEWATTLKALEMRANGAKLKAVAAKLGVSVNSASLLCRRWGSPEAYIKYTKELTLVPNEEWEIVYEAIKLRESGAPWREVGDFLGSSAANACVLIRKYDSSSKRFLEFTDSLKE